MGLDESHHNTIYDMKNFWKDLPKPFFALAPMDEVTGTVFRHVVQKAAPADLYFTEFTNAAAFCSEFGRKSTYSRLLFTPDEQPLIAQIWGTNPDNYSEMCIELKKMGYVGIDINMGCPVKDVVKKGSCAALIETPELAAQLIAAAKQSGLPVSIKTRIGFKAVKTEQWFSFLLSQNLAAITVHGRTAKEMSKVPNHWDEVAKVVKLRNKLAPNTLIIGNGDIIDRADGLQKIKQTGVDGIMIGRGVFTNPFCFEKTPREHSREELLELLNYHLDLFEKTWSSLDRQMPFAPLKRFFKVYVREFDGASELREKLMNTKSVAEAKTVLIQKQNGVISTKLRRPSQFC